MKILNIGIILLSIIMFSSCLSSKKVVYVKDMTVNTDYNTGEVPALKLQKNDRVSIKISAKNPELAAPFNAMGGSYAGSIKEGISTSSSSTENTTYLVDREGNITFPILGILSLEGRTLEEVRDMLISRLSEGGYIQDAIVKVDLLNLRINVMGEVNHVGIIEVPDARINLLEAISKAGGLTRNAASDRVTVIREENGLRKKMVNNVQSQELFNSPSFYLQQNDIVYVEPLAAQTTPKEDRTWRFVGIVTGFVTVLFTALNLMK
ncbi:polysaccharide biosynthesis/export family protein [Sphingobacterium kitahiroshimense]|uniref:Polysaccharide biosynthesis/export family protein n=1 Tax=Sphingobacterium kitahiroshimense TaxID=470446 RepID=A0ABV0BVX0_9SPHI